MRSGSHGQGPGGAEYRGKDAAASDSQDLGEKNIRGPASLQTLAVCLDLCVNNSPLERSLTFNYLCAGHSSSSVKGNGAHRLPQRLRWPRIQPPSINPVIEQMENLSSGRYIHFLRDESLGCCFNRKRKAVIALEDAKPLQKENMLRQKSTIAIVSKL